MEGEYGYGSSSQAGSLCCDVRPTLPACAGKPIVLQQHVQSLYDFMASPGSYSPFGAVRPDDFEFYAISWSLVRYSLDRFASSEASFLTALTQATTTGTVNLQGRTGVQHQELLGRWLLTLYLDDHPALADATNPDIRLPTWNLRSIYAGLNADFPSHFTRVYPLAPALWPAGGTSSDSGTTRTVTYDVGGLHGGGAAYYELPGGRSAAQVVGLQGAGGGALAGVVKLAIARIQ